MGCLDLALAAEELCLVDVGVPSTVLASGLGLQPIITHGTASQKERFLRPFAADYCMIGFCSADAKFVWLEFRRGGAVVDERIEGFGPGLPVAQLISDMEEALREDALRMCPERPLRSFSLIPFGRYGPPRAPEQLRDLAL
jgi:hypothetical protein